MEKRQHRHDFGGRVKKPAAPFVDLAHIGRDIGVGEEGPFGYARGPTGILLDRDVFERVDSDRCGLLVGADEIGVTGDLAGNLGLANISQVLSLRHFVKNLLDPGQGIGVLMVEQNIREAMPIADKLYILAAGEKRFEGSPQDVRDDRQIMDIYMGGA